MFYRLSLKFHFLLVSLMAFVCILTPLHYNQVMAAALPGNGASISITSGSVALSFSGTSGNRYHYFLVANLPVGLAPSNLYFGMPGSTRPISEYDFISYSGNTVTVDFFYLSDGSTYTYQLTCIDNSFDLLDTEVVTYGVVSVDQAAVPASSMFIYDKILAKNQWFNTYHYLSSVSADYALSTTQVRIEDTDTHYELNSSYNNALTSATYDDFMGLQTQSGSFVSSVGLRSDGSIATGMGPVANYYDALASAQLTGGLRSSTSFDLATDEWGQFIDRVSTISGLTLSNPSISNFTPSDCWLPSPLNQSLSVSPNNGYLFTNGFSPLYMTFVMDVTPRPVSVSLSGADLITWSYNGQRLVIEASQDVSGQSTFDLSGISITFNTIRSNYPLMKISGFCVGSFNIGTMISNMDAEKNNNLLIRGFQNIQHSISNLFSGLTTGYSEDTSSDLANLNDSNTEFTSTVASYVETESQLATQSHEVISDFSPDLNMFTTFIPAFGLVSYVNETIYNAAGSYKYLITFILTLSCVLFLLGIRRG